MVKYAVNRYIDTDIESAFDKKSIIYNNSWNSIIPSSAGQLNFSSAAGTPTLSKYL
jgi:hypothetical protein